MKLVDILARELKVWPEGVDSVWQSSCDNEIYFDTDVSPFYTSLNAEDSGTRGAVITQAEWQAAVDALNATKVVEWDGVGSPPAGSTCQIRHSGWDAGSWQTADIKYISSEYLIIGHGYFKREQHFHMPYIQFRPIRTAEQVAAEEREKTAEALYMAVMDHTTQYWPTLQHHRKEHYRGLVDAGWQKVAK